MNDGNKTADTCCENCMYAQKTDIDGLIYCTREGHSKDFDMICECWTSQK